MSTDDLVIVVPWLVFALGLAVIGCRLTISRRRRKPPGGSRKTPTGGSGETGRLPGRHGARR